MYWFISDTHAFQKNILTEGSPFDSATRDFKDIYQMTFAIAQGINERVEKNDVLYHLGDWSFGNEEYVKDFRDMIECYNIHLVLGNHDHFIRKDESKYRKMFISINSYLEIAPKLPPLEGNPNKIKWDKQRIVLCHYPMRVWNQSHRGAWMLHGHCHGSLFRNRFHPTNAFYESQKTFDVGVDHIFELTGDYKPLNILEIREIMEERSLLYIDHHTPKNNNVD